MFEEVVELPPVAAVLRPIMEADVKGVIGAGRHGRAEAQTTYRNGYRDRALVTRPGTLNLRVPKLRACRPERCPWFYIELKFRLSCDACTGHGAGSKNKPGSQHEYILDP